ncbi:hypothetical protein VQ643_15970 [Pseudomonas sp. F1_0610]|uniref:hypothetical protein n=1 Tax=Pseudomonas sp. F1_0610 TaxID=3114284 RepID=UPI0039C464A7
MLNKIFKEMKEKNYDEALSLIKELEENTKLNSSMLAVKGMCMQGSDSESYSLDDIRNIHQEAVDMDPFNVNALIELAYFYYAIDDDAKKAENYFATAIEKARARITEAVIGRAKCIAEITSSKDAINFLSKVSTIDDESILMLVHDLEDLD